MRNQSATESPFSVSSDGEDKVQILQFAAPVDYTPKEVEAGNQIVTIINSPTLTEGEKKDAVWQVLKDCP